MLDGARGLDISKPQPWYAAARKGNLAMLLLLLRYGNPGRAVLKEVVRLAVSAGHLGVVVFMLHMGVMWTGPCEPVMSTVLAAFAPGATRPEIGAPASIRGFGRGGMM